MAASEPLVLDSITHLPADARGRVAVAASHGGAYPATVAAAAGLRGVLFNDAGRALDESGLASLAILDSVGIAAAVVGHETARIGDGTDMAANGVVTAVNRAADRLGCRPGQPCLEAARLMLAAPGASGHLPEAPETRFLLRDGPVPVIGLDSAALAGPGDEGAVLVTGSHGGLLGHRPETALKVHALAALFHDAGIGKHSAGTTRLPVLAGRGIGAATVAGMTARIGDARSMWETGRLSAVNAVAAAWGAAPGMTVPAFADLAGAATREAARAL